MKINMNNINEKQCTMCKHKYIKDKKLYCKVVELDEDCFEYFNKSEFELDEYEKCYGFNNDEIYYN